MELREELKNILRRDRQTYTVDQWIELLNRDTNDLMVLVTAAIEAAKADLIAELKKTKPEEVKQAVQEIKSQVRQDALREVREWLTSDAEAESESYLHCGDLIKAFDAKFQTGQQEKKKGKQP